MVLQKTTKTKKHNIDKFQVENFASWVDWSYK